jgi:acetyl esterase/lipase
MLLIGGDDDRVWPSGPMARAIADRRAAAGRATAVLTWPDAGHALAGPGTEPIAPMLANGGTANGLAGARSTAWAATIAFLKRTLLPETSR